MSFTGAHMGLGHIAKLSNAVSRSITAETSTAKRVQVAALKSAIPRKPK